MNGFYIPRRRDHVSQNFERMNPMLRSFLAISFAFLILPGMATAKAQLPVRPTEGVAPAVFPDPTNASQAPQPSVVVTPPAPEPPPAPRKPSYNSCNVSGTQIAITFDDGPHPKLTPRLLDMLKERGVKATFYVIGQNVVQYPEIMQRMVAEGHEIGNHSYTHPALPKIGAAKVTEEITKTNEAIMQACGVKPTTMRPPYGATNAAITKRLNDEFGLAVIMWSVDPLDWKIRKASHVSNHILQNTKSGAIVLAHDIHPSTIDAMPAALDGLISKGHKFVTISELIAMDRPAGLGVQAGPGVPAGSGVPTGPGVPANPVSYEPAPVTVPTP
jgi:peptidoglycan/xylan/chitin deacetylase (PgdA/CDA1 family)